MKDTVDQPVARMYRFRVARYQGRAEHFSTAEIFDAFTCYILLAICD